MTGRLVAQDINHEVARRVRRTVADLNPEGLVLGEHNHDATGDVPGDGWHGIMTYSGFSWPVWEWLRCDDSAARRFGPQGPLATRPGPPVVWSEWSCVWAEG